MESLLAVRERREAEAAGLWQAGSSSSINISNISSRSYKVKSTNDMLLR